MSTYPDIEVGDYVTADLLTSMQFIEVVKQADEAVSSNGTPQDDNELVLPVEANATYTLEMWVGYSSTSNTPDFRCDFTVPSGADLVRSVYGLVSSATATSGSVEYSLNPTAGTDDGRAAINGSVTVYIVGRLTTSGTAGNIQFRWSQNTSDAAAVTVKAGSWMRLKRTA